MHAGKSLPLQSAIAHFYQIFYRGDLDFEVEGPQGVDSSRLYPDYKCVTAVEYLKRFLWFSILVLLKLYLFNFECTSSASTNMNGGGWSACNGYCKRIQITIDKSILICTSFLRRKPIKIWFFYIYIYIFFSCEFSCKDKRCPSHSPRCSVHLVLNKTPRFWSVRFLRLINGVVDTRKRFRPVVVVLRRSINL